MVQICVHFPWFETVLPYSADLQPYRNCQRFDCAWLDHLRQFTFSPSELMSLSLWKLLKKYQRHLFTRWLWMTPIPQKLDSNAFPAFLQYGLFLVIYPNQKKSLLLCHVVAMHPFSYSECCNWWWSNKDVFRHINMTHRTLLEIARQGCKIGNVRRSWIAH